MSNKAIFDALVGAGMTIEGACGMLGNMAAESTMKPTIAQRGMTKLSDEDYTFAADNGSIDFANDSVGYGLCQWTYHTRKAALLAFAKGRGVSVGDGDMQTQFCIKELKEGYTDLWAMLCSSHDLMQCTERICKEFERPAVNNVDVRYNFAKQAFDYFSAQPQPVEKPPNVKPTQNAGVKAAVMVLQLLMNYAGYWGEVTGEKSNEFFNALHTFVEALEKS